MAKSVAQKQTHETKSSKRPQVSSRRTKASDDENTEVHFLDVKELMSCECRTKMSSRLGKRLNLQMDYHMNRPRAGSESLNNAYSTVGKACPKRHLHGLYSSNDWNGNPVTIKRLYN